MFKNIIVSVLVAISLGSAASVASSQSGGCPEIRLGGPRTRDKFFGRGETYAITVVASPVDEKSEIRAHWDVSPSIPYNDVDPATVTNPNPGARYIEFVATPELSNVTVRVSVRLEGLPADCPNTEKTSFKVQYGEPREIATAPGIDREMDEGNYYVMTHTLRNVDKSVVALIVVNYSKADTKAKLRGYVEEVSSLLTEKFKFPSEKFTFAFSEGTDRLAVVYAWPIERKHSMETNIDKLPLPD